MLFEDGLCLVAVVGRHDLTYDSVDISDGLQLQIYSGQNISGTHALVAIIQALLQQLGELSPPNGPIHLLDSSAVVIDGVRFLGTTLWTDFDINGVGHKQYLSMLAAKNVMADFNCIRFGSTGWFSPPQSVILHRVQYRATPRYSPGARRRNWQIRAYSRGSVTKASSW